MDELIAFTEQADKSDGNIFTMDYGSEAVGAKQLYGPIYALKLADETPTTRCLVETLTEIFCSHMAFNYFSNVQELGHMKQFLQRHFHAVIRNGHELYGAGYLNKTRPTLEKEPETKLETESIGIYPFRSLLNHACISNVEASMYGNKTVITVIKSVKAGEQVFDNYG